MLRLLGVETLAGLMLTAAPLLSAAPGADELDHAATRSADAVQQATRLSRDGSFTRGLHRENKHALSATAGQTDPSRSPSIDPLALPEIDEPTLAKARADIKALLANPRLVVPKVPASDDADPHPLIFISFSMPEGSLRSLLTEAGRTGTPLVLRGLVDNSMQRTAARLGELLGAEHDRGTAGESTPTFAIDPTLFERFEVDQVPTFVLPQEPIAPCTPEGCPVPEHLKIAGDVSLTYALGVMAREAGGTTLGTLAEQWRQQAEGRP